MIIDTHTHLDHKKFIDDVDEVIKRAKEAGVGCFVIPGADPKDLARAQQLSQKYKSVYYAAGVHPYDMDSFDEKLIAKHLQDPKCVAVGECGLDYYRLPKDEKEREEIKKRQKEIFEKQLLMAKEFDKPVIVHIREASADAKELLQRYSLPKGGVLHCYNASPLLLDLAQKGFYFGIGGVVTFKNAKKLVEILPKIPIEKIVLETDAPYLTPEPYRGKRNEPAFTVYVAKKVADILGKSYDEVCSVTTQNAKRLFGLGCEV